MFIKCFIHCFFLSFIIVKSEYIKVCGYTDPFSKNLNQRSLTPRWPLKMNYLYLSSPRDGHSLYLTQPTQTINSIKWSIFASYFVSLLRVNINLKCIGIGQEKILLIPCLSYFVCTHVCWLSCRELTWHCSCILCPLPEKTFISN